MAENETEESKEINNNLEVAIKNCEELIHRLRLSYDIKPLKPLSDLIISQESSLRELKSLLK